MKYGILISLCLMLFHITACADDNLYLGGFYGIFDDGDVYGEVKIQLSQESIIISTDENYYTGESLIIEYDSSFSLVEGFSFLSYSDKRWLILPWPEGIVLLNDNGYYNFLAKNEDVCTSVIEYGWMFSTKTFLIEKGVEYRAENLRFLVGNPWVSDLSNGINDKIKIYTRKINKPMLILNGFVSSARPELYKKNSRLKVARVLNEATGRSIVINFDDTPSIVRVDLSSLYTDAIDGDIFSIQIIESYAGSRYDDLCVSAILPDFAY